MARLAKGSIREKTVSTGTAYELRFSAAGRRQSVTLKESDGWTRTAAAAELDHIMAQVRLGQWRAPRTIEPAPQDDPTFHEFATEWYRGKAPALAPRTRDDYLNSLSGHLLPFFKDHRLSEITIREVDRYV